jgi:hypothetical protein
MRHRLTLEFRDPAANPVLLDAPNTVYIKVDGGKLLEYAGFLPETLRLIDGGFTATFDAHYWWPIPPYALLAEGTTVDVSSRQVSGKPQSLGQAVVTARWEIPAVRSDLKIEPLDRAVREDMNYTRALTTNEYRWLTLGENPLSMDDKWFVFFEDGSLYFHQSWTGLPVLEVEMKAEGDQYAITRAWYYPHPTFEHLMKASLAGWIVDRRQQAREVLGG